MAGVVSLCPALAAATGGGHGEASDGGGGVSTFSILLVLLLVAGAYLLAHFVVERFQKALLVVTGFEYMLLGALLGPNLRLGDLSIGLAPFGDNLRVMLPVVALAAGWVGLTRGMELDRRRYRDRGETGATRVVLVQTLLTGGLVGGAAYAYLTFAGLYPVAAAGAPCLELNDHHYPTCASGSELYVAAAVLGCVAAAGSFEPVEILKRRYSMHGKTGEAIRRMAAMSDLIAIVIYGLLFCIFHHETGGVAQLTATEWSVVSVGLGVVLGVLFTPFLGQDDSENGRFLAMVGIITFAAGAAYFLELSPLFVNLCLGATLVNTSRSGRKVRETLDRTRRPMALVLLVFAGVLWRPVPLLPALILSSGYVGLRILGKFIGGRLAVIGTELRPDYFRGLLSHGTVSVAMAVGFQLVYDGPAIDLAYTAILVSVVFNDLVAPRVLRGLLVDTGDIKGETPRVAAA
jgi:Kef-type K+ transport system membrane component KefB